MDVQRRVKALGYGEQRIEALGQTPYIDFELKDGTLVRLSHPLRLDEDALRRFEAWQRGDGLDREALVDDDGEPRRDPDTGKPTTRLIEPPMVDGKPAEPWSVRLMKAVLGAVPYRKLVAEGLSAAELAELWQSMSRSPEDSDPDPKDS